MRCSFAVAVCGMAALACADIVGADFDGYGPIDEGAAAGSGGVAGSATGGGGGAVGGTAGAGGSTGGTAGAGGSTGGTGGATGGSGGSTGGSGGSTGGSGGSTGGSGGSTGGSGGSTGGSGGSTGGAGGSSGAGGAAGSTGATGVVINEVRGEGGVDYIELFNNGPGTADIGGWGVSDSKIAEAVRFASNERLAPGEYLLVFPDQTATGGPDSNCYGLVSSCYHGAWGVSQNGEVVFLLDANDNFMDTVTYPDLVNGQTVGRIPNGTGSPITNLPTPGAENQAFP